MSSEIEISELVGETVVKQPGTLNGAAVALKNLDGCKVYLLDHTSEVEVSNVAKCEIFIGPVDGPARFLNVVDSRVAVAAQIFQAIEVSSSSFDLHTRNQPSFQNCSNISLSPWQASYPGIEDHFASSGLDLNNNQWRQAQDISDTDSEVSPFTFEEFSSDWSIPPTDDISQNGGYGEPNGIGNGYLDPADFTETPAEHPKLTQVKDRLKERQESQEATEKEVKTELVQKATDYLEEFYANRKKRIENRAKNNRENEQALPVGGVEGSTEWDKATKLIDFNFSRPNGTDLSRFKNVMFTAKSKNVPIQSKSAV